VLKSKDKHVVERNVKRKLSLPADEVTGKSLAENVDARHVMEFIDASWSSHRCSLDLWCLDCLGGLLEVHHGTISHQDWPELLGETAVHDR